MIITQKKINTAVIKLLACSLTCLACSTAFAEKKQPEVELTHWWNQPGELQALDVIKQAVEKRGGKFVETRIGSWDKLRSSIISRISLGYPPAITQWLADENIFELSNVNAIHYPPTKLAGVPIKDILLKEVYEEVSKDGKLVGLPLGIHIQNAALFNASIYDELKLPLPTSWQQVLEQAPIIQEAGYVPVAFSKELWQFHIVFNAILFEKLGVENYQRMYEKGKSIKPWRKALTESLQVFMDLKEYADPEYKKRSWDMSAKMLGDSQAAMHVMGDFAKGELTARGLVAGKDFHCSLTPGADGNVIYAIDSFLMLNIDEPYLKEGQKILFEVALDPQVQAAYNSKKGSIPVRHGVDLSDLDACSKESYRSWTRTDKETIPFSGIANPLRTSFIHGAMEKSWSGGEGVTAEALIDELIKTDESSLK